MRLRHRSRRTVWQTRTEEEVNTRPPGLCTSRFPSTAKERCEQVFFAGVGSSRVDGVPLEADVSRNVEGFRAGRCDSNDPSLPMPNAVAEIDGLGRWKAATDHEARVQKRIFESVTKFRVAHSITSCSSHGAYRRGQPFEASAADCWPARPAC